MDSTPTGNAPENEEFIHHYLISHQSDLRAYILSALGDYTAAMDVLQQTNVVLLRKAAEFKQGERFLPWAFAVARYEILGFIRNAQRNRVVFTPEVTELMCDQKSNSTREDLSERRVALHSCLETLSESNKQLLEQRYTRGLTIQQIADEAGRANRAVASTIARVRHALGECIQRRLKNTS